MAEDARYRTRVFLDYLEAGNIVKPDGSAANYIVAYGFPKYPLTLVFNTKNIDVIFSIGEPNSTSLKGHHQTAYGYLEHVPIIVCALDTETKWSAEAELRRVTETYPTGSQRSLERRRDMDQRLGGTTIYMTEWILSYGRATT